MVLRTALLALADGVLVAVAAAVSCAAGFKATNHVRVLSSSTNRPCITVHW